jgi:hypothetical protein
LLLARWFLNGYFSGVALVPAGFVLGVGAFALLAVPMLIFDASLEAYLWAAAALVVASLLAASFFAFAGSRLGEETESLVSDRGGLMWAPFVLLVGALAYIARITAPSSYGDIWVYLAWARAASARPSRSSGRRSGSRGPRSTAGSWSRPHSRRSPGWTR